MQKVGMMGYDELDKAFQELREANDKEDHKAVGKVIDLLDFRLHSLDHVKEPED